MNADPLLDEQIAYYRAIAGEYETHVIPAPGQSDLLDRSDSITAVDAHPR